MLIVFDIVSALASKSVSYGIWYSELQRAHVTVARGIHFQSMGYTVSRLGPTSEGTMKTQKRLELLPEEALYLVERGAMFCWRASDFVPFNPEDPEEMAGVPISVQEAYVEMIGRENLTLEKYQVCQAINHASSFLIFI